MFPSSSPQSHPHHHSLHLSSSSSSIHHHHQHQQQQQQQQQTTHRQSKPPHNQAYPQSLTPLPQPNRVRNPQPNLQKALPAGLTSSRTTPSQSNTHNDSTTQTCANCGTQTTPLWRRNQSGETLCNACALFQKMKGRPRPISLKTNVIKPRNRIKAVDRIPLAPSSSHNRQQQQQQQQQQLLAQHHPIPSGRNNNNNHNHLADLSNQVVINLNSKNLKYHPSNQPNLISPTPHTPLHLHSFHSTTPIAPHLSPSSSNPIHSPTSQTRFLGSNLLTPSPNNHFPPASSQSPSSSQNSFCSIRSTPQHPSQPIQLVRSGVSSRKSSPGGVNPDCPIVTPLPHEAKRRKYVSEDLLAKSHHCDRRISTGSMEPLQHHHHHHHHHHQHPHIPLRASSLARITPTLPLDRDHQVTPSNDSCDQLPINFPLGHSFPQYHASADDNPQTVSAMPPGQKASASIDCVTVVAEDVSNQLANASSSVLNRGRSTLRPSRITLPPLSQITKDFVPAFQLNPSLINFGPPLSFEASAREAILNSPSSSQHLLTIPSSTHQKKFEKRRAVSVISSVSDSESVISPVHTGSTSSRIDSPLDRGSFHGNDGFPAATSPPDHREESNSSQPKNFSQEEACCGDSKMSPAVESMEKSHVPRCPRVEKKAEEKESQSELNRLKKRIVQLELMNGAMVNRISELENHHDEEGSDDGASKTSSRPSRSNEGSQQPGSYPPRSPRREHGKDLLGSIQAVRTGPSDDDLWMEESGLEDAPLDGTRGHSEEEGEDEEEQEDQIEGSDDEEDDRRRGY